MSHCLNPNISADVPANEDPDGDGTKVTFNLRFPGQYFDAESGLHYSHTRYFAPRTGRYLQPDLMGMEGGVNVYTYANGNPVNFVDPTGTAAEYSLTDKISDFFGGILGRFESSFIADNVRNQHFDDMTPGELNDFAFAMATAPLGGEGAIIAKGGKSFALGLESHLDEFAKFRNATTWKDLSNPDKWRQGVLDALGDPDVQVHFNLDGVDIWQGIQRAASGRGTATDWELLTIRQNPQFWDTLQFWLNGKTVPNPFK